LAAIPILLLTAAPAAIPLFLYFTVALGPIFLLAPLLGLSNSFPPNIFPLNYDSATVQICTMSAILLGALLVMALASLSLPAQGAIAGASFCLMLVYPNLCNKLSDIGEIIINYLYNKTILEEKNIPAEITENSSEQTQNSIAAAISEAEENNVKQNNAQNNTPQAIRLPMALIENSPAPTKTTSLTFSSAYTTCENLLSASGLFIFSMIK